MPTKLSYTYQLTSAKGQANGYAALGADGKVPTDQLPAGQGGAAWGGITGTISDQSDLQTALNGKVPTTRTVNGLALSSDITLNSGHIGLGNVNNTSDAAKPVSTATQTALDAKQATSEKGATNGYASLGADGKVPSAQLPAASDAWSYVRLASDFTTTSATAVDVTGLAFTPAANTRYEFEAQLMLRTATATVNPRAGLAWSTGLTDGVASIDEAQSATAILMARGNIAAALLVAVGGLPNTTQSWPCTVWGFVVAGASPSGSVRIQLASETAGTTVRIVAGSFLKYRVIP